MTKTFVKLSIDTENGEEEVLVVYTVDGMNDAADLYDVAYGAMDAFAGEFGVECMMIEYETIAEPEFIPMAYVANTGHNEYAYIERSF